MMPKILIVSHSPYASTGYGRVVRALAGSLMAAGNQIICLGVGSKPAGKPFPYPCIPWPKMSPRAIGQAIDKHHVDVLLTIGDPWMFEGVPTLPQRNRSAWVAYYPVDGSPLPQAWKSWAKAVDVPVVFSKFARDVVTKATGKPPELIYHGVNTQTFTPNNRHRAKELAHVDGHFVVGTVARNQLRKNIPALIKAFAQFAADKDDTLLYLHTQMKGEYDIAELVRQAGIVQKTRITAQIDADKGVADHLLATVYQAMDVFVLPTMAEGFGLPIMEAQACGTPALVTDYSACPELVPDPMQRLKVKATLTMARNFEQAIVDEQDIVEKLNLLYGDRDQLKEMGSRCEKFSKSFDWNIAYRQFNQLITPARIRTILAAKVQIKSETKQRPFSNHHIAVRADNHDSTLLTPGEKSNANSANKTFDEVAHMTDEATAKMKDGAADEAARLLRSVVHLRPHNPDFQNQLAVALQACGNLTEAINHYRKSLELRPDRHQVWSNLGLAYMKSGEFTLAKYACTKALELAPKSSLANDLHGMLLVKAGRVNEAQKAFYRALKYQPDFNAASIHLAEIAPLDRSADPPSFGSSVVSRSGLTEDNAVEKLNEVVVRLESYPGGHEGRGVVIVGGGLRYFPCAWICIRMLREHGCNLSIELWHLGPDEMPTQMANLVSNYGVRCVDGQSMAVKHGLLHLGGWELKPFAILHSRFREVLLLDADNFPLADPSYLFEAPEFRRHGAVFWPDYKPIPPTNPIWALAGVEFQDEPAFESGQVIVDKSKCWECLQLAMWLNQNSDFWYRYSFGDKDTFHIAWRKLGSQYAMPSKPLAHLSFAMGQHDFAGRRIFQHRNRAKWVLHGWNPRTEDFDQEARGFAFLDELRKLWPLQALKFDVSATTQLQTAWTKYNSDSSAQDSLLSTPVTDPVAWSFIGRVASHTSRFIDDAHTTHLIKAALAVAPDLAELHAIMGTSLGALGQLTAAKLSFETARRLCPTLPGIEKNLSYIAACMEDRA